MKVKTPKAEVVLWPTGTKIPGSLSFFKEYYFNAWLKCHAIEMI